MKRVNPVKKLIISISVTLLLFSSAFFLLEENVIRLKSKRIKDIIGRNVEEKYFEKTDVIIFGLKRFIGITEKKLDFLVKTLDLEALISRSGDKKAQLALADFISSDPYCKRIRVVNSQLEILFSTSPQDVPKSKLNVNIYGAIFKNLAPNLSRVVVDPLAERIIFYKIFERGKGDRAAILFYYSQDALDVVFSQIEDLRYKSLKYKGFLITAEKIVLVNFPEIDASEGGNLSDLVKVIQQNDSGALRLLMIGLDKTIYYKRFPDQYTDWTVGLALDTEHLRISRIGMLILVVQALVIVSVLFFIVFSLRRRRHRLAAGGPAAAPLSREAGVPTPIRAAVEAAAPPVQPAGEAARFGAGAPVEAAVSASEGQAPAEGTAPMETGVISLSDIEELVDVEEIGEAEVAGVVEEVGGLEESAGSETEIIGLGEFAEELGEFEEPAEVEEALEPRSLEPEIPEPDLLEPEALEPEIPEPEALEPEVLEPAALGPLEVGEPSGMEETILDDRGRSAAKGKTLPKLEELVKAGRRQGDEGEEQSLSAPPTIPEEMYREKQGVRRDDELSQLITRIEEKEEAPVKLKELIKGSLRSVGITKGALLAQGEDGLFSPRAIFGLCKKTGSKLVFDGNERIYTTFLQKGKTLYIREKVFKNKEVARKFDRTDSSKIQSLIVCPVLKAGDVKGILLAGISKGKKVDQISVIDEIRKIKEKIIGLF